MLHDGFVRSAFGIVIRSQLVDFAAGQRLTGIDPAMRDAVEAAGGDVVWDDQALIANLPPFDVEAYCLAQLPANQAEPGTNPGSDGAEGADAIDTQPRRRGRPPNVRPLDA